MSPKVFISHASEDKERFVLKFAEKLRNKGIDVWLDKWEMILGDSLVSKIFEEGIKDAHAIIVVLSSTSVTKPWVIEELNISFVNSINKISKLIPIIIDECEIPECLKNTLHKKIGDLDNYDSDLDEIVMAIFGQKVKPPLGKSPQYTKTIVDQIGNLTSLDNTIMKIIFDINLDKNRKMVYTSNLIKKCLELDISENQLLESLNFLDENSYIKLIRDIGPSMPSVFFITDSAFEDCARSLINNYKELYESVAYQLVNTKNKDSLSISKELKQKTVVIENVLIHLKNRGLIKITSSNVGIHVHHISIGLKRALENNELN